MASLSSATETLGARSIHFLKEAFGLLQKIGKSLMLPVSVLPIAGILLGVGSAHFSWMPESVSVIMAQSGGAIFGSLPLIFAIAVAVGLTENDGVAALAATVGFMVFIATLGVMAKLLGHDTTEIMGMKSVDTGVFGGIVTGGMAAFLFKRFYRIQLPTYLGFFAGKRFVPIITALSAIGLAMVTSIVWPPIQGAINQLSHAAAYGSPAYAATLYGIVERLLVPFGLHHIWNVPFFFEIGSFIDKTGKAVHGDINRFFAGDPTAGILGGAYLFKMWGLPAAGLAIWQCAKPDQKAKVGSIMISAALTSFLTGITEPLEFSFLFVAPILYFVHALLAGAGQFIFGVLGAKLGFTFSQGFIDYVLYYSLDTKPWLVLILGPIFALVYYGVFRSLILALDLKTPGREMNDDTLTENVGVASLDDDQPGSSRAQSLIAAFGGRENLKSLDACITRLRIELNDVSKLRADQLKALGASGVLTVGSSVQAIFGPLSENLKAEMEDALKCRTAKVKAPATQKPTTSTTTNLLSPAWLAALGGVGNVIDSTPCALTRMRVVLRDQDLLDEKALIAAGVQAVVKLNSSAKNQSVYHLLVGLE